MKEYFNSIKQVSEEYVTFMIHFVGRQIVGIVQKSHFNITSVIQLEAQNVQGVELNC